MNKELLDSYLKTKGVKEESRWAFDHGKQAFIVGVSITIHALVSIDERNLESQDPRELGDQIAAGLKKELRKASDEISD